MSKVGKHLIGGLRDAVSAALCEHQFQFERQAAGNGVVGRCTRCKCRFTAWPGGIHYDEIAATKPKD
mgnify:CR=1 FL=1